MALQPDTVAGSLTLTSGSAAFTTVGTNMATRQHKAGDTILLPTLGLELVIGADPAENSGTLSNNCPAAAAGTFTAGNWRIRYQSDNSRIAATQRNFIQSVGTGILSILSSVADAIGARAAIETLGQPELIKTSAYTAVSGDCGTEIVLNKATPDTLGFDAVATLGSSWFGVVKNIGAGTWTLDPNGAETIDNQASITLAQNESLFVWCNGVGLRTAMKGFGYTPANKAGDTFSGNVGLSATNPSLTLNKAGSGQANFILAMTNLVNRWWIRLGNAVAEAGSNVGSDFDILRFDDSGALLGTPLSINRASGVMTLATTPVLVTAVKGSSSATSSTTLINVSGMQFTLTPGDYHIEIVGNCTTAGGGGHKIGIGGTATVSAIRSYGWADSAGSFAGGNVQTATGVVMNVAAAASTLRGSIDLTVSAAGTMNFQYGQNSSNATVSTLSGASMVVSKIS